MLAISTKAIEFTDLNNVAINVPEASVIEVTQDAPDEYGFYIATYCGIYFSISREEFKLFS